MSNPFSDKGCYSVNICWYHVRSMWHLLRIFTGNTHDGNLKRWMRCWPALSEYTHRRARDGPINEQSNDWSPRWAGAGMQPRQKQCSRRFSRQALSSLSSSSCCPLSALTVQWGILLPSWTVYFFPTITWGRFSLLKIMKSRPQREKLTNGITCC